MAAELKAKYGVTAELIEGGGGVFDVVADDQTIFSKHQADRFPEDGEIVALIDQRRSTKRAD